MRKVFKRESQQSDLSSARSQQCWTCEKRLRPNDRVLYVEEQVGRVYCSEDCILSYFEPEIGRLESEYYKQLRDTDLNQDEREALAHLRWTTVQEPDEIWCEKTVQGDFRYTLISEFQVPEHGQVWSICICLLLNGEPSFMFLSFATKDETLVEAYRKGESVKVEELKKTAEEEQKEDERFQRVDSLADSWTEAEEAAAERVAQPKNEAVSRSEDRRSEDEVRIEETLTNPDEVWKMDEEKSDETLEVAPENRGKLNKPQKVQKTEKLKKPAKIEAAEKSEPAAPQTDLYHFIKRYEDSDDSIWFVVVAKDLVEQEQIEILDAFVTDDESLVESYRKGSLEASTESEEEIDEARVFH